MEQTHITLLQRLRNQQDEKSWDEFAAAYRPFIHAVLRRLGLNHHDAEDLSQEVLLKSWKALPEYKHEESKGRFRAWLSRISVNTLRSWVRQKHTKSRTKPESFEWASCSDPELDNIAEQEWQLYISDLAWQKIKDNFVPTVQQSFLLSMEGITAAEIAQRLGLAVSSVRINKYRVTAAMCKEIVRLDSELS
jgi:RNA polymerase sigma-70 factor (ECF subfamily)